MTNRSGKKKMYKKILVVVLVLYSLQGMAQKKKAVFIIADGIPADVIEKLDLPHIKTIINDGAYLRMHHGGDVGTYNETPTISAPGYNNVITGVWYNKHNVNNNKISAPNYNYHNIFRILKEQYPDKKIGVFSSWIDNRTKLVGDNLPQAGSLKVDYHTDGYELDTVRFPHDKAGDYFHLIDNQVVQDASQTIRDKSPDLSWVYLEESDSKGHHFGDGPQFYSAVQHLDEQVGRIYTAIKYREQKFHEDWMLVITTDHGRTEIDGKSHGGQTPRQRTTWLVSNVKELNTYAQYFDPRSVDIMPTILRFLDVKFNKEWSYEADGTPLTGPVSVAGLHVNYIQQHIDVSWKALDKTGNVKIWVTTTNNYKTGGKDDYVMLGEIPVNQKRALIDVSKYPSEFYKIVVEAPYNTANKWLNTPQPKGSTAK